MTTEQTRRSNITMLMKRISDRQVRRVTQVEDGNGFIVVTVKYVNSAIADRVRVFNATFEKFAAHLRANGFTLTKTTGGRFKAIAQ